MTEPQERKDLYVAASSSLRRDLQLIPPFTSEFTVYGGTDTVQRAREWATEHRYLLAKGVPACAHGLYLMGCPGRSDACHNSTWADHGNLWVPDLPARNPSSPSWTYEPPFLLFAPYADKIADDCFLYAAAHGLDASSQGLRDGWYGAGSLPIRLTVPDDQQMWPIEREVAVLLSSWPVKWDWDDEERR